MQGTAFSGLVRMACEAAGARGFCSHDLLTRVGIDQETLKAFDERVPLSLARRSWDVAGQELGDPLLALRSCASLDVGSLQIVDYWSRSSRTLGDALEVVVTCHDLLSTVGSFRVRTEGELAIFEHRAPSSARQVVELALGMVVDRTRRFSGVEWQPREVRWSHTPPQGAGEYEDHFGARCTFGHSVDALVFDRELLELPLTTHEPHLETILRERARGELAGLTIPQLVRPTLSPAFEDEVRAAIQDCLFEGRPDVDRVAERLGMSRRSLQRHLKAAGTSHRSLLSQARASVAEEYFGAGRKRREEIAQALAYSSIRSLERAFAVWKKQGTGPFRDQSSL